MDGVFWGQAASWEWQWEKDLGTELVPVPVITVMATRTDLLETPEAYW